jgi:leucyl aminopeptidase
MPPTLTARIAEAAGLEADWLILPVAEDGPLSPAVAVIESHLGGLIERLRQSGDITGKANETVPILNPTGIAARRVLAVGIGTAAALDRGSLHEAAVAAGRAVSGKACGRLAAILPDQMPVDAAALAIGGGLIQGCIGPGLRKATPTRFAPNDVVLVAPTAVDAAAFEAGIRRAAVESRAVTLARELVNTPPCDLYPESFAERARDVAGRAGVECTVLDQSALRAERMGALLGVAQGSDRPPRLVVLRHVGDPAGPTLALVGKGVTFDSGGLSLKTNDQMADMKCDMAGAAAVLAAVTAAAELKLPVNLLGVMALVENMPSGRAVKLGDVLHSRSGKTIEILNADAEGRVILADALNYAADQGASHLLDLATLTGACMVALGASVAGLMGNDEQWTESVLAAANRAGERAWSLPLWPIYEEALRSTVADLKNAPGNRFGGAITAAKFLEQFVGGKPWAHLDIAGPAWADKESATQDAGGTGYGVRTMIELALKYPGIANHP